MLKINQKMIFSRKHWKYLYLYIKTRKKLFKLKIKKQD